MKKNFAESARPLLAKFLLAIITAGPLFAVCGIIISSIGTTPMDVLITALKLV